METWDKEMTSDATADVLVGVMELTEVWGVTGVVGYVSRNCRCLPRENY